MNLYTYAQESQSCLSLSLFVLDIDLSCVCFKNAAIYSGMENAYN